MRQPSDEEMMTMMKAACLVMAITLSGAVGCTSMSSQQQGTLSGAALGAAAGAGISALAGGNAGVGAVAGGALGAVVGNIEGRKQQ
jgi:hypothetical protein